jgi:hypothetical protein
MPISQHLPYSTLPIRAQGGEAGIEFIRMTGDD